MALFNNQDTTVYLCYPASRTLSGARRKLFLWGGFLKLQGLKSFVMSINSVIASLGARGRGDCIGSSAFPIKKGAFRSFLLLHIRG